MARSALGSFSATKGVLTSATCGNAFRQVVALQNLPKLPKSLKSALKNTLPPAVMSFRQVAEKLLPKFAKKVCWDVTPPRIFKFCIFAGQRVFSNIQILYIRRSEGVFAGTHQTRPIRHPRTPPWHQYRNPVNVDFYKVSTVSVVRTLQREPCLRAHNTNTPFGHFSPHSRRSWFSRKMQETVNGS